MTKEDIANILAELEADLKKGAEEAKAAILKKADEGDEGEDSNAPAEGSSPEAPEASEAAGPAAEGSSPAAPPEAPPAGPEGASPEAPPAGDPAAAAGGDPAAGGELTPEALQAEYAQLPPEELDMHIQAALAAKEALQGAAGPGAGAPPPGAMPPPGPEGASAGGPPPGAPPMMGKTQLAVDKKAQGGQISAGKAQKSEEIAKLEALVKSQQEDIENLSKVVKTVLETPVRKSVTALSDVAPFAKTEIKTLSKKEVDEFIRANAPKMTKAERELWLSYVDNKVPAAKLAPMFERLSSNK